MEAKELMGIVPKMPFANAAAAGIPGWMYDEMNKALYHRYTALVADEIQKVGETGMFAFVAGQVRHFYPVVALCVNDHPEGELMALHSHGGSKPCRRCLASKAELHKFDAPLPPDRNAEETKEKVLELRARVTERRAALNAGGPTLADIVQEHKSCPITSSIHLQEVNLYSVWCTQSNVVTHTRTHKRAHAQNAWWYVDMGANPRSIHGGAPPDFLHNGYLGWMKESVVYSLTLVKEAARERGSRGGTRTLELLNRRVQQLPKQSERRLPRISFRDGLGFLVKGVNVAAKRTQEEVNHDMHAAGGGMTSRDWFPALIALSGVVADDYEHELLPPAEKTIVINALERCIDVSMVLKKDSLTETELVQLDRDIRE